MKKRVTILGIVLALALVFGSFSSVFAAFPDNGIETSQKIKSEVDAERIALNFLNEVKTGKYKTINTADLKADLDAGKNMLVVDTMPEGWYAMRHVPSAVNAFAPLKEKDEAAADPREQAYSAEDKKILLDQVKAYSGTKSVKYKQYYNKKTKKWVNKKPAKKYLGKTRTRTKKVAVKNKKIVVYCGFVVCTRSHVAAKYLVEQGYTNVYRYPGGISAWVDAEYPIEGTDTLVDYVNLPDEEWAALGIDAGNITNADYVVDLRPDAKRESDGFVPGAKICPVSNGYTADEQTAIKAAYDEAAGARVVLVCVSGNKLARNAMAALQEAGADMSKVTYLKGGFGNDESGWKANYPVVAPDKKSVEVPAWVTEGKGTDGKLAMVQKEDGTYAEDLTHHVLVNENGSNAPVALLNTKALPLQVYNALKEIGGTPYDQFNAKDQTAEYSLAGKGSAVNVSFVYGDNQTAEMKDFFKHVTTATADVKAGAAIETEDYVADMRFGGCYKNIEANFDSPSGNQTGCITCTFSCWIGTVSNGQYEYSTQEALVNRDAVPAAKTPVKVVYTIAE